MEQRLQTLWRVKHVGLAHQVLVIEYAKLGHGPQRPSVSQAQAVHTGVQMGQRKLPFARALQGLALIRRHCGLTRQHPLGAGDQPLRQGGVQHTIIGIVRQDGGQVTRIPSAYPSVGEVRSSLR